jgi:glc operon protein GlcG
LKKSVYGAPVPIFSSERDESMNTMTAARFRIAAALPLLAVSAWTAVPAAGQGITYEEAARAMDAAEAEARRNQWNLTIVITDADGVPIYLRRMEGASQRTYQIAMAKARTALASGMATADYGQALAAGRTDTIPDGITFAGGYPLRRRGEVVGAMSASGARANEDAQAARAGMAAIGIEP